MEAILDILFKAVSEKDVLTLNQACISCGLDSGKIIKHVETDTEMAPRLVVLCGNIIDKARRVRRRFDRHPDMHDIDKIDKFHEEQEQFLEQCKYIIECMKIPPDDETKVDSSLITEQELYESVDVEKLKSNACEVYNTLNKVSAGFKAELSKEDLETIKLFLEYSLDMVEELESD